METLTRKIKYTWANRLSYEDRRRVVNYYLEGYGLYRIGETFGVTASTIEYHLKAANVFIPYKRPTLFGTIQKELERKQEVNKIRTLVAPRYNFDNKYSYENEFGERCFMPKSYARYLQGAQRLAAKNNVKKEIPESTGFVIRVSLITSETIYKQDFFRNEEYPMFIASNSLISY